MLSGPEVFTPIFLQFLQKQGSPSTINDGVHTSRLHLTVKFKEKRKRRQTLSVNKALRMHIQGITTKTHFHFKTDCLRGQFSWYNWK